MKDARLLVLSMLEEGKITAEEAQSLLEALGPAPGDGRLDGEEKAGVGTAGDGFRGKASSDQDGGVVDLETMWDEAMHLVGKARDRVEDAIQRTRRRIEKAGRETRRVGEEALRTGKQTWDDVRGQTMDAGGDAMEQAGDFFSDVERGLAKVAQELPDALSRLMKFEFGPGQSEEVARRYHGRFEPSGEGDEPVEIFVSTDDGAVRVEGVDGDEYEVDVVHKVRSDDGEDAEERADEAAAWEASERGFRIVAGRSRDVRSDVVLRLPKGFTYALDVQTSDGSVTVQDVRCVDLHVSSADGGVRLERVDVQGATVLTADGSVRMEDVDADRLTVVSSDGSLRIQGDVGLLKALTSNGSVRTTYVAGDGDRVRERVLWDLRTSDGSVRVGLPDDEATGYDLDLASTDGTVRVDLPGATPDLRGTHRRDVQWTSADFGERAVQFIVRARTADGSVAVWRAEGEERR